jgi:glycerophosphoryl diester phosphodiesterase
MRDPTRGAPAPTELRSGTRTVRLKWHQVRRRAEDAPFARGNIRDGLAAGASLEVDIRPLACGRWVCLHDPQLENETTGSGPVTEADAAAVRALRMRDSGERLLMLEELIEIARTSPTGPGAVVQLDFQTVGVKLEEQAVANFGAAFAGRGERFVLSGYDWTMVQRLGAEVTGLVLGWDPSREAAASDVDVFRLVRETAPEAQMVYLNRMLVRLSHERGDRLVARLAECGHQVDCWTLDHGEPRAAQDLAAAVATGCHQITTNTAVAWVDHAGSG